MDFLSITSPMVLVVDLSPCTMSAQNLALSCMPHTSLVHECQSSYLGDTARNFDKLTNLLSLNVLRLGNRMTF